MKRTLIILLFISTIFFGYREIASNIREKAQLMAKISRLAPATYVEYNGTIYRNIETVRVILYVNKYSFFF